MGQYHRSTDISDVETGSEKLQGEPFQGWLTSFESNIDSSLHFIGANPKGDTDEGAQFYVTRAKALELAEHFVGIANDLAKPDRFGVKQRVKLFGEAERAELYSVGMTDGINSERRVQRTLFGDSLTAAIEGMTELREWLASPR